VGFAAMGILIIWHLVRRGRLIREGLAPPRVVPLPEVERAGTENEEPKPWTP